MPTFDIFSELELTRQSFETTRIHFKSDVFFFVFFLLPSPSSMLTLLISLKTVVE